MVRDAPVVETPSGVNVVELACSAERVFMIACGQVCQRESGYDPDWLKAAAWTYRFWYENQNADDEVPFVRIAKEMYEAMLPDSPAFGALPAEYQVAFEATCRHLLGLITCDKDDLRYLAEREASWSAWATNRLAKLEAAK